MSKTYLVIGGNSGIGRSLVERLVRDSNAVYTASRSTSPPTDLEVNGHFSCDVTDAETELPEIVVPLNGLVYLPGTINLKPFPGLTAKDFQTDLEINYLGAVKVLQRYLPNLKSAGNASIVLMSTVAAGLGLPYHASVSGAKGAVEGLTRALAAELAPAIRVNAVAPSPVDTPLARSLLSSERKREDMASRHPARTIGDPNKLASLIAFLLYEDASWMTGQVVHIDGGL